MALWVAALDDGLGIRSCIPTIEDGRCYKSETCKVPKLKFEGRMMPFTLKFCKDPFEIAIHFHRFDLPWWAKVDLQPVVIGFKNNDDHGMTTVRTRTTITAKVKWFNIPYIKAKFYVDGMMRQDCRKPENDWLKRVSYNLKAPDKQYTSNFYKLKMRVEIKQKKWKWRWFRYRWRCISCEDIFSESRSYGSGHKSCEEDMERFRG